jgi:hypothetical protein
MLEILRYPVLSVSQGVVLAHFETGTLAVATKHALQNGYFDEMWLVDSAGKAYDVRSYEAVDQPFWKRPKTPFGRGVLLRNFVLQEKPATFDEVRDRVTSCVEENPSLYEGMCDPSELVRSIRQASTISALLMLFGADSAQVFNAR